MTQALPIVRREFGKRGAANSAFAAEHGLGVDDGAGADFGVAGDDDMGEEAHALAEHGIGADEAEGADLHAGAEHRAVFDDGGRVHRHDQPGASPRIMALNSASAHSVSPA